MYDRLIPLLGALIRKHAARHSKVADALELIHVQDDGGSTRGGIRALRLLANSRRVSNYPDRELDVLQTDRANALAKLNQPLSEAIGHLITIELAEQRIKLVKEVHDDRLRQQGELTENGVYRDHRPLIDELHNFGVCRGDYNALGEVEYGAIARYILRKAEQAQLRLPPLRTDRETRGPNGRRHSFWDPYHTPRDGRTPGA